MKKLHILGLAIFAAVCAPMAAQASDGTISFNGELKAATCTVTTNSVVSSSFGVTLPTLSTALLSAAGNTAGDTAFSITVGSCTVGLASFTPYFESGATIDPLTGRLKNTGGAGNVQLQLLNSNGTIIDAAKPTLLQNVAATPIVNAGGVGRYAVRYYATGMTTAGTVVSTVTYSMVYI